MKATKDSDNTVIVHHKSHTIPKSQKIVLLHKAGEERIWIGKNHYFSRTEVELLIERLQHWLEHGELEIF